MNPPIYNFQLLTKPKQNPISEIKALFFFSKIFIRILILIFFVNTRNK